MEKLEQGQVWKVGEEHYRIVAWQRLSIEYKHFSDWVNREGTLHKVSKKEFCRIIRHGELLQPAGEIGLELETEIEETE